MLTRFPLKTSSYLSALMAVAGLSLGLSAPAHAGLTISTSISDSVSTAVGSVSGSIKKSSESSTKDNKVAAGDYQVIDVAVVPEQPGMSRVHLQAQADARNDFYLYLPTQALDGVAVTPGATVTARERPYGVEFAAGAERRAFFLVMEDAWWRELPARRVAL
jgi:hypothetical protein